MKLRNFVFCLIAVSLMLGCRDEQPAENTDETKSELAANTEPKKEEPPEPPTFGEAWAGADEAARTDAFDDPNKLRGLMTYELVRSATPETGADEVGPYSLAVANDKTKDLNRAQDIEIRRMRSVFVHQARIFEGQDLATLCKLECQREAINAAFSKAAGGPIFGDDGNPNADAVKKLFSALYVEPDAEVLGLQARELYTLVKPAARDLSGIYAGLEKIGLESVQKSFDAAVKENPEPESGVNTGMLKFYRRYTNLEGVSQKGGLEPESLDWTTVGFWMRRIDDGTATELVSLMTRFLEDYDPEWHAKHFADAGD